MKFLMYSNILSDYNKCLEVIEEENPDVVYLCGNITKYGDGSIQDKPSEIGEAQEFFKLIDKPLLICTGYTDINMHHLKFSAGINVTDKTVNFKGYKIAGINIRRKRFIEGRGTNWQPHPEVKLYDRTVETTFLKGIDAYYNNFKYADIVFMTDTAISRFNQSARRIQQYINKYKPKYVCYLNAYNSITDYKIGDTKLYNIYYNYKVITL